MKEGTPASEKVTGVMLHGTDQAISALIGALETLANPAPDGPKFAPFLSPPAQTRKVSEEHLIDLFDLTPTEARVAALL